MRKALIWVLMVLERSPTYYNEDVANGQLDSGAGELLLIDFFAPAIIPE